MAEYKQTLLEASTSTLTFNTPRILVPGMDEVFLEVVVDCTAINLICDFSVGTINTLQSGRVLNATNLGTQICANQTGYSFSGGYYLAINNPPIGRSKFHIRMSKPAKYMGTYHTYSSGGGTVRLVVNAWGWQKNPTP